MNQPVDPNVAPNAKATARAGAAVGWAPAEAKVTLVLAAWPALSAAFTTTEYLPGAAFAGIPTLRFVCPFCPFKGTCALDTEACQPGGALTDTLSVPEKPCVGYSVRGKLICCALPEAKP